MNFYLKSHSFKSFIASQGGQKAAEIEKNGGVHFTLPLKSKNPLTIWRNSRALRKIMIENQIDIVHARSRAPAWAAWLACRGTAARYITTFHGTYGAQNWLKRAYNRVMLKGPLVIANSAFIKRHIVETYGFPASRIAVATRGSNPEIFDPARFTAASRKKLRAELGLGQAPLLVHIGRLARWKGHHVFIESLQYLRDLEWQALVVGGPADGPYGAELRALVARLGLSDRVRLAGNRGDVPALLDLATLAYSCSIEPEAFGRATVEAAMMGKPVIATALGGSLEIVEDGRTGWLVAPNRPQQLAERTRFALTHPKALTSMGARARTRALEQFTTTRCCALEAAAYEKLLKIKQ